MKKRLSANEKAVLRKLIQDGRAPCTDIAKKLDLTSQAVGKIIGRLEKRGVIKGYEARIDYRELGIEVFAIAFFRFKSGSLDEMEEKDLWNRVRGPHLIKVYRLSEGEFTHIVIYGFRSIREMEHYFHLLQKQREHVSELKKYYVLSADSVMKDSMEDLLLKVLEEMGHERLAEPEVIEPVPRRDVTQTGFFS